MNVMGYPAVGGAVDTNSPLAAINIPIGQVQAPQATTTMSMPTTLDSASSQGDRNFPPRSRYTTLSARPTSPR